MTGEGCENSQRTSWFAAQSFLCDGIRALFCAFIKDTAALPSTASNHALCFSVSIMQPILGYAQVPLPVPGGYPGDSPNYMQQIAKLIWEPLKYRLCWLFGAKAYLEYGRYGHLPWVLLEWGAAPLSRGNDRGQLDHEATTLVTLQSCCPHSFCSKVTPFKWCPFKSKPP